MINLLTLNGIFHLLVLSFQHLSTSPETMRQRQFVFAYGSLINPESRAITNPSLADQEALPVMVSNVERVWSARTISGYTAMGVRFREGAECSGVLLEVNAEELADLDEREKNYIRLEIHLDNVDQVPFLPDDVFYENEKADIIFDAKEKQRNNVKVWVYVQKEPIPADASHPIPQSYVDVILKGCLTISTEFARSFIDTTKGWHNNEEPNFVDDREMPLYVRADPEVSEKHGLFFDELLEEHRPIAFDKRVDYDPEEHLEALQEALEEEKAHPKAVMKALERLESMNSDTSGDDQGFPDIASGEQMIDVKA